MDEKSTWPELAAAIHSTRNARDRSARAAQKAGALGIPTLKTELDELAARYDRLLASLLQLNKSMPEHRRYPH